MASRIYQELLQDNKKIQLKHEHKSWVWCCTRDWQGQEDRNELQREILSQKNTSNNSKIRKKKTMKWSESEKEPEWTLL